MSALRPAETGAGILLYSAGIFFFAANDALGKWLVTDYSVGQIMFLRAVGAGIPLAFMLWRRGVGLRVEGQYGLHLLRVLCSAADTFAFYFAARALPLADVMTFYLAAPLMIVGLSGALLGERMGAAHWMAVLAGFAGVVIALHPSAESAVSASSLMALAGAFMFAGTMVTTRSLRGTHWLTLVAYQVIGSGVVGAAASGFTWVEPGAGDVGLMFAVGIVSMACFIAITKALALAPASLLAPFQYASIVWAAIMGWIVWGDIPTANTLLGVCIIVASGLFVLYRERVGAKVQGLA